MRKILRAKSPYCTSDPSLHARTIAPSASATCLWCGRTLLVLLAILSAVLRPVFAAFQNPPLPHHGHKRAVFALLFAAFLLLSGGNARAQGTPDLVVLGPDVRDSIETGATFWFIATVTNAGDAQSAATTVRYLRSTDATITESDTEEGTDEVRALLLNQGYAATIRLTAPSTAGTYYYGACVDAVAGESDTTNNCSVSVAANVVDPPGGPPPPPPGPRQTVPGAPRNLLADATDGAVTLTWDAPENDDGSEITDYEYRIDRRNPWISIGSTQTTHTVTGLDNGTAYVFEVRAVNRIGKSFSSNRAEATPEAPEVFTLDFAHFANGTGITSDFVFVNVSPHPIRPALYFYDQEGHLIDPDSVVDVTGDLEVTEDGSLSVLTEMEPLGVLTISTHGRGELVSGSVKVLSGGAIGGGVRYGVPEIGVTGVGSSEPVRDILFPARRQAEGIRTAVALHNLQAEAMGVSCRLMSGGVALEEVEIPLEANGQTSWFIEDAFTTTDTSGFLGSVRCTVLGSRRFTAIAVEMDAAQRIFNTLSVVPLDRTGGRRGETILDFAHFANGTWITDLVFVNLETQPSGPRPHPLSHGHPAEPSRYLFLRHRGRARGPRLGGGHHGRSGDHRGRRSDSPHRDGAAGSAHDLDPRARGAGVGIGAGGLGRSHRRDAPL